jgi:hypothetical protein
VRSEAAASSMQRAPSAPAGEQQQRSAAASGQRPHRRPNPRDGLLLVGTPGAAMPGQPPVVECTVGFSLEVLEGDTWYPAQVVEVGDQRVKVRVDNWGDSSDQWLPAFSKKLRMCGAHARECRINWVKSTLVASVGEAAGVSLAQAGAAPAALPSVRQPGDGAAVITSPREAAGQSAPARGLTRSSPRLRGIGRPPLAAEIERSAVASRPPRGLLGIRSSPRRGCSRPPPHPSPAAASSAAGAPRHCPRSSMRLPNSHPDSQRLSHQLEYQWVGRHLQIRILNELICGPPTTAVFVHGPPATGKSAILNDLLDGGWYDGWGPLNGGDAERHQVVKIDCVECSSQRALLDTILNQLPRTDHPSAPQLGSDTNSSTNSSTNNTNTYRSLSGSGTSTGSNRRAAGTSWVRGERGIPQLLDALREVCYRRGNRITMIFDRAERLRELEPRLLSSILRLNELLACAHGQRGLSDFNWHTCGADDLFRRDSLDPGVLVVLVSENEWRTFRDTGFGTGVVEPTIVSFPAYSKGAKWLGCSACCCSC